MLFVIDPQTGSGMDTHFTNTFPDGGYITRIATTQAIHTNKDFGPCFNF